MGGKWYLQESGGYSSTVLVSGGFMSTCGGNSSTRTGSLANAARVAGASPSPGIVSRGRLTTTFFAFGAGAPVAAAAAGVDAAAEGVAGAPVAGSGLTFLCGPPSTALGGPPTLMLADRLLRGTNGGANCGRPTG